MKHLLTAIACFLAVAGSAQTPYNPDSNGDNAIALVDFLDFLPLFGEEFYPEPAQNSEPQVLNVDLMAASWDTIVINPSFSACPYASPDSLVMIRDTIAIADAVDIVFLDKQHVIESLDLLGGENHIHVNLYISLLNEAQYDEIQLVVPQIDGATEGFSKCRTFVASLISPASSSVITSVSSLSNNNTDYNFKKAIRVLGNWCKEY